MTEQLSLLDEVQGSKCVCGCGLPTTVSPYNNSWKEDPNGSAS